MFWWQKEEYECLKENDGFKKLIEDADKFTVEELSTKADLLFAKHVKAIGSFNAKVEKDNKTKTMALNFNENKEETKYYGNLFDKVNKTKWLIKHENVFFNTK